MTKFAIGIPTINQWPMLRNYLNTYLNRDFPSVVFYIVDNGNQGIDKWMDRHHAGNMYLHVPGCNLGVAASWNYIATKAFSSGHDHVLMLNDDIYLGKNEKQVSSLIEGAPHIDFFCSPKDWCSFILSKSTFKKIGQFDTSFYPAYFEDNDYMRRMQLENISTGVYRMLDPDVYHTSMSIKKDPSLNNYYQKNRAYYIQKWGGAPGKETSPATPSQKPFL